MCKSRRICEAEGDVANAAVLLLLLSRTKRSSLALVVLLAAAARLGGTQIHSFSLDLFCFVISCLSHLISSNESALTWKERTQRLWGESVQ